MENMKYFYNGAAVFIMAKFTLDILTNMLYLMASVIDINILLIPIVGSLFCGTIIYIIFFRLKKLVPIKIWLFITVIVAYSVSARIVPYETVMKKYETIEAINYSLIKGIDALFILMFAILAYLKYFKIAKNSKT